MSTQARVRRVPWEALAVLALTALALLIRLYHLRESPPGLYLDEAAYGLDGLAVRDGHFAVFYARNNGREPLFIYLLGLAFTFLEATPYTIRLVAALCGAATVPAVYWMVRELALFAPREQPLPAPWLAGWTALLVAISYWHVSLSRLGFRAITLPLLLAITFALLWRGWRANQGPRLPWGWALAGGFALGLSLYTYTAARLGFALFGVVVAALWLAAARYGITRRTLLLSAAISLAVALIVAAPLLAYFAAHPQAFGEHAAYVSILNPRFSGGNPLRALLDGTARTLGMLVGLDADPNLRHNPARRSAVDLLSGLWLVAGMLLALRHWRRITWSFGLFWFAVFLAPVVLSAEGVPHSLRAIGLVPAVFLLVAQAMGAAGGWLGARLRAPWGTIARHWLPLPFVLLAAWSGLAAYFGAWQNPDRFRGPFFADFVALAHALDTPQAREELWLLPLPPGEDLAEDALTTVDFVLQNPDHVATLRLDETTAPARLEELLRGRTAINVISTYSVPVLTDYDTRFMDLKGYLNLLLQNTGAAPQGEGEVVGFPYVRYAVVPDADFVLPGTVTPVDVVFGDDAGDLVRLTGVNAGETQPDPTSATLLPARITVPADQPIWAVLRWQALRDAPAALKASLTLHDGNGAWAGQVDRPLYSDRFPREPFWKAGEVASLYPLFYAPPGTPPGDYRLRVLVYDDATGQVFPGETVSGSVFSSLPLVAVTLLPPETPFTDTQPLTDLDAVLINDLQLVGIDAPQSVAPGDTLRATLHLRADRPLAGDPRVRVTLRDGEGAVVASQEVAPGGDAYPLSRWRAGETLRVPVILSLNAAQPAGIYRLVAQASGGPEIDLGAVEIVGRPRVFDTPPLAQKLDVIYGDRVRLMGIGGTALPEARAGETLALPLVWQPLAADARSLVRFVQLLGQDGQVLAQQDVPPCEGDCPASSWLAGEILADTAALALPATLDPGAYTLLVGWYDAATQQRLAAVDLNGAPLPDDVARLTLDVRAP